MDFQHIFSKNLMEPYLKLQAAPISGIEMIIGFVGATASKSILLGTLIIITSSFFL